MTRVIRYVGDVHGNMSAYFSIIKDVQESIQLGDLGLAPTWITAERFDKIFDELDIKGNHKFYRGNHDCLEECKKSKHFINDGTVDGPMMIIGGALSIDKAYRTPGVDWWKDEELSYKELNDMLDLYEKIKPKILLTHDCPEYVAQNVMIPLVNGIKDMPSRTRMALETMRDIYQPIIHVYAHWHKYSYRELFGTQYICIPIGGYIDIDVDAV